jgi:hypothetical protein
MSMTQAKCIQSIKTMSGVRRSNQNELDSSLLKLYMLEKERKRLRTDQYRMQLKLEFITERLREIDKCFIDVAGTRMIDPGSVS